jgi:hypothetical protein
MGETLGMHGFCSPDIFRALLSPFGRARGAALRFSLQRIDVL